MRVMNAVLSVVLTVIAPVGLEAQTRGLIVEPFHTDSAVYGHAGQVIEYSEARFRVELMLDTGPVEAYKYEGDIVPFASTFTPAYVLAYFRQCAPNCRGAFEQGRTQFETWQERLQLVQAVLRLFPDHSYVPDFRAIECTMLEPLDSKMPATEAAECVDRFVADHPEHPRADELAWLAVRLRNAVYEFEGYAPAMVAQAEAYAEFAEARADRPVADRAWALVARLYYMAQEVSDEPEKSEYRQRADELYTSLTGSSDESVRLRAIIERFNLRQGRRIYMNPNAWTCALVNNC